MEERTKGWGGPLAGAAAIAACWAIGTALVRAAALPLPGSLVGMALLTLAVRRRWLPEAWVRPPAEWLIRWMALFFVPAGVAVSVEGDRLAAAWLPIAAGALVSTLAVLVAVGWLHQRTSRDA